MIENLKINADKHPEDLRTFLLTKLKIPGDELMEFSIRSKSIDARKKDTEGVYLIYKIEIALMKPVKIKVDKPMTIKKMEKQKEFFVDPDPASFPSNRPIVIGFGPSGIFAALKLAERGFEPIVLERGKPIEKRLKDVNEFWKNGVLDEESNVQFGEGGAGTFSDGKLTTRTNSKRNDEILRLLVSEGAPEEILYLNKPHIGTDRLRKVIIGLRKRIIALGGEVRFESKVTDLIIEDNKAAGVVVNGVETLYSGDIILATGHSAVDVYEMLMRNKVKVSPKAFAIGLRIEHTSEMINKSQYGKQHSNPLLGAASYQLTYQDQETGRGVYTFCMCPGGVVVASSSDKETIVVNGMSYYKRDGENSNSALIVTVKPEDYGCEPKNALEYLKKYEKKAFFSGGGGYKAPVQLVGDFLQGKMSSQLGGIQPTYTPGTNFAEMDDCLPDYVCASLRRGILYFDKKIDGFARADAVLTGVETRTSAPVRVDRNQNTGQSVNIESIYPAGEGAGYAGGIISAAVDGIRSAEKIIEKYS
ncbi:MAG: hypothetical protein HGA49_08465 [Eubacteriaceae bacterium]|nr:hypothetical protein [Eubacteriaceae bacterium]